ncbi:hypothetical protein CF70_015125 [Cupriavidus sp. SK-3]|uniref:hypothetical protein n=1 Tax=Cupriavidus sp. SK-3 TaxID=1470558 RepID=UPI000451D651|nr:hypothetical protein [Cupriavidus sp. SK-3]KDP85190.1 hypothetical protein CF70_015125 [Cupriavidus sp. SK-3]
MLSRLQRTTVVAQVAEVVARTSVCPTCGAQLACKGHHHLVFRSAFGRPWGFLLGIRQTPEPDDDLVYGPANDHSDYFTRAAAEQAALDYGRKAIDVFLSFD